MAETPTTTAPGSQTLARGLNALQLVADAPAGLTVQQVADGVEDGHQVFDIVGNLQRVAGLVGVAVTEHVDGPGGEVLGVRLEVADIGLGVSARPVE